MKRFRNMPTAAMIVAVIALVLALGGTGFAAKKLLKLGAFSDGAKNKTVGVGKLTYVNAQQTYNVNQPGGSEPYVLTATCPTGTHVLGGGTKLVSPNYQASSFFLVEDYPTTTGFTSRFFAGSATQADTVQVTAACGISRAVTGAPPAP
jgi:hypothetical protein